MLVEDSNSWLLPNHQTTNYLNSKLIYFFWIISFFNYAKGILQQMSLIILRSQFYYNNIQARTPINGFIKTATERKQAWKSMWQIKIRVQVEKVMMMMMNTELQKTGKSGPYTWTCLDFLEWFHVMTPRPPHVYTA